MIKRLLALFVLLFLAVPTAFAAADDISRLYNFTSGTTIQSSQVNGEFNQLISTMNTKFGRDIANTVTGNNTFSGANVFSGITSFTSGTTPIKTDKVDEYTSAAGVTVDGVLLKDAGVTASTFSTDTISEKTSNNGVSIDSLKIHDGYAAIPNYIRGCLPAYASASTITINATCAATNSTGADVIVPSGTLTLDITASGANGLDTGSEASGTWYYVYLIKNATTNAVAGLLSVTNEAASGTVTLPSGYTLKRQLPIAVRNNGSSNFIPFVVSDGWPFRPVILFRDFETTSTYRVLNAGTANSFTAVDCSAFIPGISKMGKVQNSLEYGNTTQSAFLRATGSGLSTGVQVGKVGTDGRYSVTDNDIPTDASQSIDYTWDGATLNTFSIFVRGFVVTEVQ